MKMRVSHLFFIGLLVFPIYSTVASEPEGTGVFALNVDDNSDLKDLTRRITNAIRQELESIKEKMMRGVRDDLKRYEAFEREIKDKKAVTEGHFYGDVLKDMAQRYFPDIYPTRVKEVQNEHPALWYLFKFKEFSEPTHLEPELEEKLSEKQIQRRRKSKEQARKKVLRTIRAFKSAIKRTKEQFNAIKGTLEAITVVPVPMLHITLCECGVTGCLKENLGRFFKEFYDTSTQCVSFSLDTIDIYPESQGWIVLKVTSRYIDELIQRLRQNGMFTCTVRTPYRAHISVLHFDHLDGSTKGMVLIQLREFLLREGDNILNSFVKDYHINIRQFGIKKRGMEFLHTT